MILRKLLTYGILTIVFSLVYLTVYGSKKIEIENPIIYDQPSLPESTEAIPICNTRGMAINAKSALIVDNSNDAWIYAKHPTRVRPIASLTKLLTAMVYLDLNPNLDTTIYISGRDCYESAKSHIYKGEAYIAKDLLIAALMSSDNRAARAIATASGMARLKFIEKMNQKARAIGMMDTKLFEVTGLDERNVATASDVTFLIKEANKYPVIKKASSVYTYRCKLQNKNRYKRFINTNRLVRSRWKVEAGKTGFILEADYCLASILKDKWGKEITVVVLGSPTNNIRFSVARKMAFFGFKRAGRISDQIAGR
ncbi:MAG: serine hydrolase [candidate division Zixibacteria bacterium]|nr:serine hydrolase [candidate division Zixibacteria bacterium]